MLSLSLSFFSASVVTSISLLLFFLKALKAVRRIYILLLSAGIDITAQVAGEGLGTVCILIKVTC